jgi:AraC-like DNA-binding protein
MALTTHTLHQGALLKIHCVCCRPHDTACGAAEHTGVDQLALPLRGVFLKHHAGGPEVVAATGQALFFNKNEEYRVSHPAGGEDDCLVFQPAPALLDELLERFDPAALDADRKRFRATHSALPAAAMLERSWLWRGLRAGADTLEIEERALQVFGAALAGMPVRQPVEDRRPLARRRRQEQVRAAALALAAQPEESWSLQALAQRVHASPFHLARSFKREQGETIHQYLLRARLARGLELALETDGPLTAIALRLGFATPSHFTAAFRRLYGSTPTGLRRRLQPG